MVRAEAPALWPELLWKDGFHPSPLGSLLAALVLARWLGLECRGDARDAVQPAVVPAGAPAPAPEAVAIVTAAAQRVWERHFPAEEPGRRSRL